MCQNLSIFAFLIDTRKLEKYNCSITQLRETYTLDIYSMSFHRI